MRCPPERLISTDVALAVERLRAGGLVAIPTETVYGLAADARSPAAVARIFEAKGRPRNHPLIVHLTAGAQPDDWVGGGWVGSVPDGALRLAAACWPGPLTMVLPRGPLVIDAVTGGRSSVGVRVPAHPVTRDLLARFGGALAAPSANRFGRVSPTTARHVVDDLGPHLDPATDLVLDGGPCEVGVESTIVDLTAVPPQVLRAGAITDDEIERLLAAPVAAASGPSRAAGMLASHYAPACRVLPAADLDEAARLLAESRAAGERSRVLDRTADLVVFAQRLYSDLRAADADGLDSIVVVAPPPSGLGHAIRDRLAKASA